MKVPLDEIEIAVIQLPLPLLVGHPQGACGYVSGWW